ncbi:MAG: GH25 family lysozyme [Lachnospiraceae bacterium]
MRELKAVVLIITLVTGILGVMISDTGLNSTNIKTDEYASCDTKDITEVPCLTATPVPSPVFLASETLAPDVEHAEPDFMFDSDEVFSYSEIEIPEIVVAEMNDAEDPEPNKTQDQGSVTIVKEEKLPTATPKPTDAGQAEEKEEYTFYTKVGIDVSKWNGEIDWKKVAADGVEFAMIRTGYRGNTYGKIVADPYFYKNIEGALANGIEVGVYFYSQAVTEKEAVQEAAWVCELIKNYNITYPVAYDLEEVGANRIKDVSYAQLNKNARAFLDYVNAKGYWGSMYGCKSYFESVWDMSLYTDCHIWLAHYTSQTNYTGHYDMWQFTENGKVNGISTSVDLNYAYFYVKNEPEEILTPTPVPSVTTTPEPTLTPTLTPDSEIEFMVVDQQCVVTLTDGTLNVREKADINAGVLDTLENGVVVHRIGISENGWSQIEYGGSVAYVSSDYLVLQGEIPIVTEEPTPIPEPNGELTVTPVPEALTDSENF